MNKTTPVTTGSFALQRGATSGTSAPSITPASLRGSACLLSCVACLLGFTAQTTLAAPPNDDFANAIELVGTSGNQTGTDNIGATFEVGELECLYPATTNTVWFKWVAPDVGTFTISTTGSTNEADEEWDSVVCIYTGTTLDSLTRVKEQDIGIDETVSTPVTPGVYYIQLGGWLGESATNINLNWSFLMNVVDISGELSQVLDAVVGVDNSARLIGNTKTHWQETTSSSDVSLNGYEFNIDTGSGNKQTYNGAITGPGTLRVTGRADASWDDDAWIGGTEPNTPDSVILSQGRVTLDKASGVDALAGSIIANGGNTKRIWLRNNAQISDTATIDSSASGGHFEIHLNGFSERFASLTLGAGHKVNTGAGGVLQIDSLSVDGVPMPKGAYTAGSHNFVSGTGYIDVDEFGPPVIDGPPAAPASPTPADGANDIHPAYISKLEWGVSDGATSYEIYLWPASESKPVDPMAFLFATEYALPADLLSQTEYNWQLVAENAIDTTAGPVWSFTTVARWELSGDLPATLDSIVGEGNAGLLVGNAKTTWQPTNAVSDVDLNGFELTLHNGGGNAQTYNGALTGPGTLRIDGRFTADWEPDIRLGGTAANTPDGVIIQTGRVTLNKPAGIDALAGPITMAANDSSKRITLENHDQINDASTINSTASGGHFEMDLAGFDETVASLTLAAGHFVNTGPGGVLTVDTLSVGGIPLVAGTYTSATNSEFVSGTGSVVVVVGGGTFETWAAAMGLAGQDAAFDADPDGDGIPNGIEFVIGGEPNPAQPDWNSRGLLPTGISDGDNFVFTYTLMNEAAYLNVEVEFDTDLDGTWTVAADPGNATIDVAPGDPAATITVTIPKDGNLSMFSRLKVTEP